MPLRLEIEQAIAQKDVAAARKHFGLDEKTPTLLVTGGSLGARSINQAMASSELSLGAAGIQLLHIVGSNSELPEVKSPTLVRIKYCDRMDLAMAASDLAVCRSGASTVCEFGSFGLPSVFVPYPVGNGEQRFNAADMVDAGAARLVLDKDFNADYVRDQIIPLISNTKKLKQMATAARDVSIADGTRRLYDLVQSVLPNNSNTPK
jgi:UDP-N-acetylglucosamine--N-acetylmuramyl-(pentapeptide) pyrophosphoryl-undecaprenol N-acetylglucosamine transferase